MAGLLDFIKTPRSDNPNRKASLADRSQIYNLLDNIIGFNDDRVTPGEALGAGLRNDPIGLLSGAVRGVQGDLNNLMFEGGAMQRPQDVLGYAAAPMAPGATSGRMANVLSSGGAKPTLDQMRANARQRIADRAKMVQDLTQDASPVRMKSGDLSVLVSKSPDREGWRVTYFQPDGSPSGHVDAKDKSGAVQRALEDQFKPVLSPKATQPGLLSIPEQTAKPKTSAAELRRQANIQRFGYDPSAVPEAPAPQDISEGFQAYLNQVNPDARRIPPENRPNLMMGDMYGMLPKGAKLVKSSDDVSYYRGPEGDYFATAYNPDVGEMDVVGYSMGGGRETDLQVVDQMQGKGIGGELQYLFRKENPNAPTGGLTEAGEKSLQKTYKRLSDEGILSMIPAPTPSRPLNPAEQMAKDVLDMRAAGRAGEVTEEMRAAADPQYMYFNTPLPMDEASRMARSGEIDAYHGTDRTFSAFDASKFGEKDPGWYGRGVTTDTDPEVAGGYANYDEAEIGQQIIPLRLSGERYMDWPEDQLPFGNRKDSISGTKSMQSLGYAGSKMTNDRDFYGGSPDVQTEYVTFNPANVRSRFALFDPEFKHLRNLSAGVGGMGLLGMSYPQEGQY